MSSFFGAMFRGYLKTMSACGQLFLAGPPSEKKVHRRLDQKFGDASFEAIDEEATRMGNKYRGVGVVVGSLGIAIVFFAIAPFALPLSEQVVRLVGVIEVLLMLVAAASLFYAINGNLHSRWIDLRKSAEKLRYADLRQGIALMTPSSAPSLDAAPLEPRTEQLPARHEARSKLMSGLEAVFGGDGCQIKYNQEKAGQYRKIERFSNVLAWGGFSISLVAAVMHLFWHNPVLLLATGYLPALVGGIHGINHFLRIGDLAEDHAQMAERLAESGKSWDARASHEKDDEWLLRLSEKALRGLEDRDTRWEEEAKRRPVAPIA